MKLKIVEIQGKDARDFLHRVTTVDMKNLELGMGSTGLLLSGTGKVLADFSVLSLAGETFWLVSEEASVTRILAEFERMHFSEELEYRLHSDTAIVASGSMKFSRPFPVLQGGGKTEFPLPVAGFMAVIGAEGEEHRPDDWERGRIFSRVPKRGAEWIENDTSALDCGFLAWIDRTKGCYPGQEAVERALNVGHPAKALVLLEGGADIVAGDDLVSDRPCGKITSAVRRADGSGSIALGIVQWAKRESESFEIAGKGVVKCLK